MAFFVILIYNEIMGDINRIIQKLKTRKKLILTIFLVVFVVYVFSFARVSPLLTIPYYIWVSWGGYSALLAIWALSIKDRIIERDVRRYSLAMAFLMIFFVTVRSIKWEIGGIYPLIGQLSWYMYYIPHILLPLLLFLIALSIDKKLYARYRQLVRWFFLIAGILITVILTNSVHQIIFKIIKWESDYDVIKYQPYAYSIVIWLVFFIGGTVTLLIIKSKLPHTNKRIVLPLFVILFYVIYLVLYSFNPSSSGVGFVEFMVTECLVYIALIESLIYVGLIPSNSNYQQLFENSPIPMMILDDSGAVLCKSNTAPMINSVNYQLMADGEQCDIDNWRLSLKQLNEGRVLWLDDMTDINNKIKEIEVINKALLQENDLLKDEIILGKKEIVLREKDRIYNSIEQAIYDKRALINKMIKELSDDEITRRVTLMRVSLIGAYIKRMSNIILLEEMYDNINAIELQNAITESLFSYRLKNEATQSKHYVDFMLSSKLLKMLYACFENELEYYFERNASVEVFWSGHNNQFELIWQFRGHDLKPYCDSLQFVEQLKLYNVRFERSVMAEAIAMHFYIVEAVTV